MGRGATAGVTAGGIWNGRTASLLGGPATNAPSAGVAPPNPGTPVGGGMVGGATLPLNMPAVPFAMGGGGPMAAPMAGVAPGGLGGVSHGGVGLGGLGLGGVALEASVAERAALSVLDDFTDTFNLENANSSNNSPPQHMGHPEQQMAPQMAPPGSPGMNLVGPVAEGVPIPNEAMLNPVLATDGQSPASIEEWLLMNKVRVVVDAQGNRWYSMPGGS